MLSRSSKKYLVLFALTALFILPFAAAWIIYHSPNAHHLAKKNHGDLISPSHNLATQNWHEVETQNALNAESLKGKWGVLLVAYPPCHHPDAKTSSLIEKRWNELDKVKISLGKDQARVVLIQAFPGLNTPIGPKEGEMFIFDPLGNLVLQYKPEQESRDIRKDLKQLLHASQIG